MRHVSGPDGAEWEVFAVERLPSRRATVRDDLADGWLCFQRADGHRVRVPRASVPENWRQLGETDLLALIQYALPLNTDARSEQR